MSLEEIKVSQLQIERLVVIDDLIRYAEGLRRTLVTFGRPGPTRGSSIIGREQEIVLMFQKEVLALLNYAGKNNLLTFQEREQIGAAFGAVFSAILDSRFDHARQISEPLPYLDRLLELLSTLSIPTPVELRQEVSRPPGLVGAASTPPPFSPMTASQNLDRPSRLRKYLHRLKDEPVAFSDVPERPDTDSLRREKEKITESRTETWWNGLHDYTKRSSLEGSFSETARELSYLPYRNLPDDVKMRVKKIRWSSGMWGSGESKPPWER
jgi:hypothetical protein